MIRVSIDPSSSRIFRKVVTDFEKKVGRGVEESVVEVLGKSSGRQLAHKVPPWGLSAQAGKKFEGSVAKQANRAVNAANVGAVRGSTAEQAHASARDGRGQVPKGLRTRGKRVPHPIPVGEKERLIDKKQAAAGLAKGAWIAAANSLPGKALSGIPRWISRHAGKNGSSNVTRKGISSEVELRNELGYIQRLQSGVMVKAALKMAYQNSLRQMERILNKIRS